jgi:hypothetical protein
MMSADKSVQVGIALLSLGAAAVLARLGYVWTAHSHFWDAWAIAGVVAAGLGFAIMMAAWVMPSRESSPPSQRQVSGAGSTNLQAGRDITLHPRNEAEK